MKMSPVLGSAIAQKQSGWLLTTVSESVGATARQDTTAESLPRGDVLNFGSGARGIFRAGTSFLTVLTLVLIGLQFVFSLYRRDLNDPDIWWHMRNAQMLLEQHHFPRIDTFSFTVAGQPWINHEWLSEIPYYLAYRAFGLVGLKTVCFLVFDAIFLLLLYLCFQESRNFKASVFVCYFATFLSTVSFGPRTVLFGYLYLVLLLIALRRFRERPDASLWLVPPLFLLWVNTHGSWSLGLVIFFLFGVAGLAEGSWARVDAVRWTPKQLRHLIVAGLASLAALFVNPFGWRLVYYPFDMAFKQKLNIAHVAEWVSVDFHDLRGKMVLLLVFGLLLGALFRNRRWNLGELLILLFALYSGLTYIRFLVLLGIVVAPVLAKQLDFFPLYRPADETPRLNAVVMLILIGVMLYFWPRERQVRASVEETYPSGIVSYLNAHPLQGNTLNLYLWGGYLEWHVPALKTFVDSRVDVFEHAGIFEDYLTLMGADMAEHRPDAILQKYKIQYVLFPPTNSKNPLHLAGGLVYVLRQDPHWKTIYEDKVCILFERQ
jgi:multisubunit Na+/H+ antiporter MnhB subunit